ncbi:MAG: hypothetical protein ACRDJM_09055 [Actinomycetota bacterium]
MRSVVDRAGETVARKTMGRRAVLGRGAGALFGLVTAWTVTGFRGSGALAAVDNCARRRPECGCIACGGIYCTSINANYCDGAICQGGCSYYGGCGYPNPPGFGCWCTATCCYNNGEYAGYYECCDCQCPPNNTIKCSCRRFVTTCRRARGPATPWSEAPPRCC